ncbi:hypothetical protein DEA98_25115 [Brucella pseudogrignonensis]|nr:hypothetical protein [Brucella pseudogrignonensis]
MQQCKHCELRLPQGAYRFRALFKSSLEPLSRPLVAQSRTWLRARGEDQNVIGATTSFFKGTKVRAVR